MPLRFNFYISRLQAFGQGPILGTMICAIGLLLPAASSAQQTVTEDVVIAAEAMPEAVDNEIKIGRQFEQSGKWIEALTHYESALREHPGNRRLEQRFDHCRLHTCLDRRYADASFLEVLGELDSTASYDLYGELLAKIESHYVVTPPWSELIARGANAMLVAAQDKRFATKHGVRINNQQLQNFRNELQNRLNRRGPIRSADQARNACVELCRAAESRLGARENAWALEFVAATAGGLDHYSSFLTPGQLRDVYSQIEGNFVGLGVELKADNGALLIVRVIPGSPAERAGIGPGDRITAVDGQPTAELSTDEAAALLTGSEGSFAMVTVTREAADGNHFVAKPNLATGTIQQPHSSVKKTYKVRREHVDVPSLEDVRIIDENFGVAYARIPVFQKSTARDLESALWDLHRQGMRSLVLDLRGNPGGLLTASVELADKFVSQGNLVSTRGRSEGEDFDYRAHRAGTWRVPLVVLIDGDSASASEIFAAAIRDNRRGTIVGSRSFGKGSVQGIFPMTYAGAGIRLTTAKFFSPKGHPISKVGVDPDIVVRHATSVAGGLEEGRQRVGFRGAQSADPAFDRALETAKQQVAIGDQRDLR